MSGGEWFYADRGERRGPVDDAMMQQLMQLGAVDGGTLVWRQGMTDWEPAHRHFPTLAPPPPDAGRLAAGRAGAPALATEDRDYHERVGLGVAFRRFWLNYVNFSGRANRGEYWWAVLALVVLSLLVGILDVALFGRDGEVAPLSALFSLAAVLPSISLSVRRLHDTDRTGWWLLISFIPFVGWLILFIWYCTRGTSGPNRFG